MLNNYQLHRLQSIVVKLRNKDASNMSQLSMETIKGRGVASLQNIRGKCS